MRASDAWCVRTEETLSWTEDLDLARRASAGDADARRSLQFRLSCVRKRLARRNRSLGRPLSETDLDDLEQDVMLRVFASLDSFAGRSSVETWIGRLCDFAFVDGIRKLCSRPRSEQLAEHDHALRVDACQQERAALRGAVEALLDELASQDRRVVELHVRHGLSFVQIGELTHSTPAGAKARYYRAMSLLRARLDMD